MNGDEATDYFFRTVPSIIMGGVRVTAEDAWLLAQDQAIFGNAFIKANGDGTGTRVDPATVTPAEPQEAET